MHWKLSEIYPTHRAFVTGAASGLGRALCTALAADGWTIGICDIMEEELKQTRQLISRLGGRAIAYNFDVSNDYAFQQAAHHFISEVGGIDILINNAGVGDACLFGEYPLEHWKWMIGINQMGVIYGCHFFVPVMKRQRSGHIINISSAAAFSCAATMAPYNVSKAAVLSLSETLYVELFPDNVNVSVVMPTFFRTNIMQHSKGMMEQKVLAEYLLATSGLEAEEVACYILQQAGKKKFYIIYPFRAKCLYGFKRCFPSLFLRFNVWMFRNKERIRQYLKRKYDRLTS